jgi:hypothetical protein
VATLVLVIQALRRRLTAEQWVLLAGNVAITFIALRYMSQPPGNYYFAPIGVLAAGVVASAISELLAAQRALWTRAAVAVLVLLLCVQGYRNVKLRFVYGHFTDSSVATIIAAGAAVDRLTNPDELIVVRSPNPAYDDFWRQPNNYHDPRVFFISKTRGWTIGREQEDVALLEEAGRRGARFFVDPLADRSAVLDGWLSQRADLVWTGESGARIWQFRASRDRQQR